MSNTGTYIYDKQLKKVVKISDKVTDSGTFSDVTFKQPFITWDINGKPIEVKSARHKRDLMKAHGIREPATSRDTATKESNKVRGRGCTEDFVVNHLKKTKLLEKWKRD